MEYFRKATSVRNTVQFKNLITMEAGCNIALATYWLPKKLLNFLTKFAYGF